MLADNNIPRASINDICQQLNNLKVAKRNNDSYYTYGAVMLCAFIFGGKFTYIYYYNNAKNAKDLFKQKILNIWKQPPNLIQKINNFVFGDNFYKKTYSYIFK